jgi:serine/threonine protein kinase
VSSDCIDILYALLTYNPDERITAKDALKHVFLRDVKQIDFGSTDSLSNKVVNGNTASSSNVTKAAEVKVCLL